MKPHFLPTELPVDQFEHHLRMCRQYDHAVEVAGYAYIFMVTTLSQYRAIKRLSMQVFLQHLIEMRDKIIK